MGETPRTVRKIWMVEYRARNGHWYVASRTYFDLCKQAERARKHLLLQDEGASGDYRVMAYIPATSGDGAQ